MIDLVSKFCGKHPKDWRVQLPHGSATTIRANTAGEARSVAKKFCGGLERLPVGTTVFKMG